MVTVYCMVVGTRLWSNFSTYHVECLLWCDIHARSKRLIDPSVAIVPL